MNSKWIGLLTVAIAFAGIVLFKMASSTSPEPVEAAAMVDAPGLRVL
jgi:ABC-type glycerol-3-phosphate transport system permease component